MATLAKYKDKVENLKQQASRRAAKFREQNKKTEVMLSGAGGSLVSSVGCAIVDARFTKPERNYATIGETPIPINAVVGGVAALGGLAVMKKSPSAGAFLALGGLNALSLVTYQAVRAKVEESYP